jgi:hypothetical protein
MQIGIESEHVAAAVREHYFQALPASRQVILVAHLVVTGGRALIIFGGSSLLRLRAYLKIPARSS